MSVIVLTPAEIPPDSRYICKRPRAFGPRTEKSPIFIQFTEKCLLLQSTNYPYFTVSFHHFGDPYMKSSRSEPAALCDRYVILRRGKTCRPVFYDRLYALSPCPGTAARGLSLRSCVSLQKMQQTLLSLWMMPLPPWTMLRILPPPLWMRPRSLPSSVSRRNRP